MINHVTLDGVMQAPGRADEDRRDGFEHGGWGAERSDDVMVRKIGERMGTGGSLLLGRRTYEQFYEFWPTQADSPFSAALANMQKYVASTTLSEPLPWANSTLLPGDAAEAGEGLKRERDEDLTVMGSGELIQALMPRGLIDEYLLMTHPLVLGSGRRLFPAGASATLRLVDSVTTAAGVVVADYVA